MLMASKSNVEFDAAAQTRLTHPGAVTHAGVGRTCEAEIALDKLQAAGWDSGEIPMGMFAVNIYVTELLGNGGEEFTFTLEGNGAPDFSSAAHPLVAMKILITSDVGSYRMAIDAASAARMLPGLSHVALSTTRTGDAPGVTFVAWLSHVRAS